MPKYLSVTVVLERQGREPTERNNIAIKAQSWLFLNRPVDFKELMEVDAFVFSCLDN